MARLLIAAENEGLAKIICETVKVWVESARPGLHPIVEVKLACAFGNEIDWMRNSHCVGIWFVGDNHMQDAVWFKLSWDLTPVI